MVNNVKQHFDSAMKNRVVTWFPAKAFSDGEICLVLKDATFTRQPSEILSTTAIAKSLSVI